MSTSFFISIIVLVISVVLMVMVGVRLPLRPEVAVLDVGQGDALLVRTPQGHRVLVDAGPDGRVRDRLAAELLPWERSVDGVVITHFDADHIGGLPAVLETFDVGWIAVSGDAHNTIVADRVLSLIEQRSVPVLQLERGHQLQVGNILLTILSPHPEQRNKARDSNAASIVVVVSDAAGRHRALLMGDVERDVEYALLRDNVVPSADILKIGHHGSRFATGALFLGAVQPQWAAISASAGNAYGHPAETVLQRLRAAGVASAWTATVGTIRFSW